MRAGRLRHKVALQRRVDTQLASGQVQHTYATFAEVFAEKSPLSAREFFAAAQTQADGVEKFRIRWRLDVDATCRLVFTESHASPAVVTVYDIVGVLPDEKTGRRELLLMCKRNPADAR